MVLVTQSGIFYLQSINLARISSILIIILNLLGKRSRLNLLLESFPQQQTRLPRNQTRSLLIKHHCCSLSQPNLRKKSISFPSTSYLANPRSTTTSMITLTTRASLMPRLPNCPPIHWKFWKLRKHSLLLMLKRLIKFKTLSTVKPDQNLASRWQRKVHPENKWSSLWAGKTSVLSWRVCLFT